MKKLLYALAAALLLLASPAGGLPPSEHHVFCEGQGSTARNLAEGTYDLQCRMANCEGGLAPALFAECLDLCEEAADVFGLMNGNLYYNWCMGYPSSYCSSYSIFC